MEEYVVVCVFAAQLSVEYFLRFGIVEGRIHSVLGLLWVVLLFVGVDEEVSIRIVEAWPFGVQNALLEVIAVDRVFRDAVSRLSGYWFGLVVVVIEDAVSRFIEVLVSLRNPLEVLVMEIEGRRHRSISPG